MKIAGAGKSFLAAGVVDRIFENREATSILCYFFCSFSEPLSLSVRTILESLIKQLLFIKGYKTPGLLSQVENLFRSVTGKPSVMKLREFLQVLVKDTPETLYIIMDGLDECKETDRTDIIDILKSWVNLSGVGVVKAILFCRTEEDIRLRLQDHPAIIVSNNNMADIRSYINAEIVKRKRDVCVLSEIDPTLVEEIITTLADRAKGM